MLKKIVFSIILTLAMLEIALRIGGFYRTYSEKVGKGYLSYYNARHKGWCFTYPADTAFVLDNGDFKFDYTTNSVGLRGEEFAEKPDSTLKIVTLGDSFTEGVGASSDSSWPAWLQKDLRGRGMDAVVYNGGMSGSDPFYEYMLFKQRLLKYKPQMAIVVINTSDVSDYLFREGFERFKPDSFTVYKKGPWYEPLWQHSRTVRFFMHSCLGFKKGNLFVPRSSMAKDYDSAGVALIDACDSIRILANSIGCSLTVVLHPSPSEVMYKVQTFNVGPWQYRYVSEETQLLGNTMSQIQQGLTAKGVPVINLWKSFDTIINKQNYLLYTYENDRHFNGTGYGIMESFIMKELQLPAH